MSLGDIYGKRKKSGADLYSEKEGKVVLNTQAGYGSQDRSVIIDAKNKVLEKRRADQMILEKEMRELDRQIVSADLRKKDTASFKIVASGITQKRKLLEAKKHRIDDEIRRLENDVRVAGLRHL
ncbi:MAG TPA: hypothetical protein VJH63_01650 [Candidatus Paceibacterota bacterium]